MEQYESPKYMMATQAFHLLGDISREKPDLARMYGENEDYYIGEWVSGIGMINVRFPKITTLELTDEDKAYYANRVVVNSGGLEIPVSKMLEAADARSEA